MRTHVQILAWLYIALGALSLVAALAAFGLFTGIGLLSGDVTAFGVMSVIGGIASFYLLLVSLPNIIVGIGLLRGWGEWVIILAVILGVLNLAHFPLGTALAIYTFWVAYRVSRATESFG
jgi:hypothetical protein